MKRSADVAPPERVRSIRAPKPAWPDGRPAVAVSFSGGGYRASLAGVGVSRALADLGLLGDIRYTSSVSGGSWANALLALNWEALRDRGFTTEAYDDLVVRPFVETITTKSLTGYAFRHAWRLLGPTTLSDLLGDAFDEWFGNGRTMGDLSRDARFIFNATNLNSGRRFYFEQARAGDWKVKYIKGDTVRIADALAASAALPGVMSAQRMRPPNNVYERHERPYLVDGAAYDNLGLEAFGQLYDRPLMVVIDAGAEFKTGIMGRRGLFKTVKRSGAVVQRQVTTVRKRWLIEGYRAWEDWEEDAPEAYREYTTNQIAANKQISKYVYRKSHNRLEPGEEAPWMMPPRNAKRGVVFSLDTSMDPKDGKIESTMSRHQRFEADPDVPEVPTWQAGMAPKAFRTHCASVKISGGKFDETMACDLIYRGWWLARESLRTFHPDALPHDPPPWREWNDTVA